MKKTLLLVSTFLLHAVMFLSPVPSYGTVSKGTISPGNRITGVTVDPSSGRALAISGESGSLYVIDASKGGITRKITLPSAPACVAMDTVRNAALVLSGDGKLYSVDPENGIVITTVSTNGKPRSMAVDKKNDAVVLAAGNGIIVVDMGSGAVNREIPLPFRPDKIVARDGVVIVAGAGFSGKTRDRDAFVVQSMDLSTGSVIRQVFPRDRVAGMAVDGTSGTLALTQENSSRVFLYDSDLQPLAELPLCDSGLKLCRPSDIAVNPSTHVAIVTDAISGHIYAVDIAAKSVMEPVGAYPEASSAAVDASWNTAYVAFKDGIAVVRLVNPVPILDSLVPWTAKSGTPGLDVFLEGSKFLRDSQAQFNGKNLSTSFTSNEILRVQISPDSLTVPGEFPVTVTNPSPGGGVSNPLTFKVYNLVPTIESLSPDTIAVDTPVTFRVSGRNFFNGSSVVLNGVSLKTRFISSILLEAEAAGPDVSEKGRHPVVVVNPVPNNFTSAPAWLNAVAKDDPLLQSGAADKNQKSVGTGAIFGRIVNTQSKPVPGVTIKIKNISTQTDAQGFFKLENIPAGKHVLLMDGSTAVDKDGRYPTIPLNVRIDPGKINPLPFQPYLHRQKNRNFKSIEHDRIATLSGPLTPLIGRNREMIVTDPELPGVELRVPKGVKIIGWDGKPNLKVSMRTVPTDRLPVKPLPDNVTARTVHMFYFDKVGGGTPDRPVPFKARNDLGLLPGEKAVLWYYDESPNEGEAPNDWAIAGTGTVTPDGMYIESDPGVGIPKFCCGAAAYGGSGAGSPPSGPPPPCGGGGGPSPEAGDPVDITNGYFLYNKMDYRVPGIIPIEIVRYYRSGDNGYGQYGKGTYFNYDWWIGDYGSMLLLLMPGNYQVKYVKQADGTYTNGTDPKNNGETFIKNSDGTYLLQKSNGWRYKFDTNRLLVEIRDKNGNALTLLREINTNVSKIITPEGKTVTLGIIINPGKDNITYIDGPVGRVTYNYIPGSGGTGQLKSVNYPDGSTLSYDYDTSGRMTRMSENSKLLVENTYDDSDRVIKQTRADGGLYTYNYTVSANNVTQTSMTAPNGGVFTWRFNSARYITEATTPDGTTVYDREPGTNRILTITDPLSHTQTFVYDAKGRTLRTTDNAGNTTSYEYEDTFNQVTKITDPLGHVTFNTYDAQGNLATHTSPTGETTSYTYNDQGRPLTITDPLGRKTTMEYDAAGNLTRITDAAGHSSRVEYDQLSRVIRSINAKGAAISNEYDNSDRITASTDALGNKTLFSYDLSGNRQGIIDAKGHSFEYEYDVNNRITKSTDPLGKDTTFSYDTSDNVTTVSDQNGRVTTFEYDLMSRPSKVTFNDSGTITYRYDAAGRMTSAADSTSGQIAFTWADQGCSSCGDSADGKPSRVTTPQGTVTYTYDAMGRRSSMTVQGRRPVLYSYDNAGRLSGITASDEKWGELDFSVVRDSSGRATSIILPNGVTTGIQYDTTDNILSLAFTNSTNSLIDSIGYSYDVLNSCTSMSRPDVTIPVPNQMTNASHDEANRMLAFQAATGELKTIAYDDNGNMKSLAGACGTTNYSWNARNQLVAINGYMTDCSPLNASFAYDALGRRIQKTVNGKTTGYLYDGADIVQETEDSGVTVDYIRDPDIDKPLARIKSDGTIRYYHRDALGNVIALSDETGAIKTRYAYDPYGNTILSGEASDNPFQYTGRENDGTGLYYYRARYYSPELKRFISQDPIGFSGGDINLYNYVHNNPVNKTDPFGLTDRYTWCKGKPGCKRITDWACNFSEGSKAYCCDAERIGCMSNVCPEDPQWDSKVQECFRTYASCLLHIKPDKDRPPLEPPPGTDRYPKPPGRGNPNQPYPNW